MNCKHCGGANEPGAKVCIFCGSELQEKETVYVPVQVPAKDDPATKIQREASTAMVLSLISMIFGLVIIRVVMAIASLNMVKRLSRESLRLGIAPPPSLNAARIMSILSLVFAGIIGTYFVIIYAAQLFSGSYYNI